MTQKEIYEASLNLQEIKAVLRFIPNREAQTARTSCELSSKPKVGFVPMTPQCAASLVYTFLGKIMSCLSDDQKEPFNQAFNAHISQMHSQQIPSYTVQKNDKKTK